MGWAAVAAGAEGEGVVWAGGKGLRGVVAEMRANRVAAPEIPSAWRAVREGKGENVTEIAGARGFGKALLDGIDEEARRLADEYGADACREGAEALLDAADWIGGTCGYGNALLAVRAQDVASMAIGRLLVAEGKPGDGVRLARRLGGAWSDAEARARVLNSEIGLELFGDTQEDLEKAWHAGVWCREASKGAVPEAGWACWGPDMGLYRKIPDDRLDFFRQDGTPEMKTQREAWDDAQHDRFVFGLDTSAIESARKLGRFLELAGEWPQGVPYGKPFFKDPTVAAFEHAWRPWLKSEGPIYLRAALTYEKIKEGRFWDGDTSIERNREGLDGIR
jgi:hypothetical protein